MTDLSYQLCERLGICLPRCAAAAVHREVIVDRHGVLTEAFNKLVETLFLTSALQEGLPSGSVVNDERKKNVQRSLKERCGFFSSNCQAVQLKIIILYVLMHTWLQKFSTREPHLQVASYRVQSTLDRYITH